MRIIVKRVTPGQREAKPRHYAKKMVAVAAALSLVALRGRIPAEMPAAAIETEVNFFVSESDEVAADSFMITVAPVPSTGPNSGGNEVMLNAFDSVTVDDELDDLLLDGEEIDSGISSSYNGKLDVPSNVRLDRLDFGSDFVKPLKKARITSRFDYRVNPVTGRYVFHTGMDLGAASGSDIAAMKAGKVISAKYSGGYGNVVIIEHADGIRTLYAHCSKLLVKAGDSVRKGEVIALVGSTGNSTGPHLHIEFRKGGKRYDPEWVIGGIYN